MLGLQSSRKSRTRRSTFARNHPTDKSKGHRKRSRRCQIQTPSRYRIRYLSPIRYPILNHSRIQSRYRFLFQSLFPIPFHFLSLIQPPSRCRFHCRYPNRCHFQTPNHCLSRTRYQIQSQSRNISHMV
jgi:hypothetical protein